VRILLYSRTFLPRLGGIEQATFLLARELVRSGHQVVVATDVESGPEGDVGFEFPVLRGRRLDEVVGAARRADLVHSNGHSLRALAIALQANRPLIFTHQGYQAACLEGLGWHGTSRCEYRLGRCVGLTASHLGIARASRQLARLPLARASLHLAAANVSVSGAVQRVLQAPQSSVIFNCADTEVFRPGPATTDRRRFLFLGRFVGEKGVEIVLRAVALDRAAGGSVELDLVGAGPLEGAYREQVRASGIEDRVRFRGPLRGEPLAQAIRDSLAVVVPSVWDEAFGIVAAEALACGRIALVSDRGGLPEVVEGLGTTVPAADPKAWATALRRAAVDVEWRSEVERRIEKTVPYPPDRHAAAYVKVYADAMERKP
jgi:glycogen(starch) synthase